MSTINSIPFRSTIFYRTDGTVAPIGTVFTISTNNLLNFSDSLSLNTLSASSILSFSTLSGSTTSMSSINSNIITTTTLRPTGTSLTLGQTAAFPNRYLELGTDAVDTVYLDFHSKDSTLSDYSTRIQSLGGATPGTGALNMTASTMGLMANVGIGITNPSSKLHIVGDVNTSAFTINNGETGWSNNFSMVLRNNQPNPSQFLFLQKAAGSGSFHSLTQGGDHVFLSMDQTNGVIGGNGIVICAWNQVAGLRIGTTSSNFSGNVGIGTAAPGYLLDVYGSNPTLRIRTSTGTYSSGTASILFDTITSSYPLARITGIDVGISPNVYRGDLAFYYQYNTALIEGMRLANTGNVGIGTINPAVPLHVMGSILGSSFSSVSGTVNANPGGSTAVYTCGDYQSGFILFRWGNGYAIYYFTQYPGVTSSFINYICGQANAYTLSAVTNSAKVIAITMSAGAPNPTLVYWTVTSMTA